MPLQVLQTIPILRIFSVEKAKEFYIGFLGFSIDWEHRFDDKAPLYIQVSRAGCVLHLSEHHGDCCPGSTVFLRVAGVEEYHREITAKGYGHMRPASRKHFTIRNAWKSLTHSATAFASTSRWEVRQLRRDQSSRFEFAHPAACFAGSDQNAPQLGISPSSGTPIAPAADEPTNIPPWNEAESNE